MSRAHVSNTTLSLGSTGTPATPMGKKMVWSRRKQEWMEVDDDAAAAAAKAVSPQYQGKASPIRNLLSSNAYASGVSQNSGNFLTEKPTTRIHAPPGGASSITFGDDSAVVAPPVSKPQQQSLVLGTPTQPATPESTESVEDNVAPIPMMELPPAPSSAVEEGVEEKAVVPPPAPATVISSNAYASGSNQNSGNFMTGRPTTRVRAPPGGASSITFG